MQRRSRAAAPPATSPSGRRPIRSGVLLALLLGPVAARADSLVVTDQVAVLTNPQAAAIAQGVAGGSTGHGYNTSVITQSGNNNAASTDQSGGGNFARINQVGNNDTATIQQFGSYGTVQNTQTGSGLGISITQTGNAPSITVTQTRAGR